MSIRVRELLPEDGPVLERLFGERGACGGCWCMAWRLRNKDWEAGRGASNRRAFLQLVSSGAATGVLAFDGDEPVGWCSVGPRADFERLAHMRSLQTDWDEHTWSVTCFYLPRDQRGRGVGTQLLAAAIALARRSGARALEGYPAVPYAAMGRLPAAFAWTGLPQMFEHAGFERIAASGKRPIYLRKLAPRRRHA